MAQIETWKETYTVDFERLSREWITRFFGKDAVEPFEVDILSNPKQHIIDKGGQLFFAVEDGKVLGCVAVIKHNDTDYELSKLAVSPEAQGKGLASALFESAFDYAKSLSAKKLIIESNTILAPALGLYKKYGFVEVKNFTPHYKRVNIKFEKELNN